jgi:hypothetical protein
MSAQLPALAAPIAPAGQRVFHPWLIALVVVVPTFMEVLVRRCIWMVRAANRTEEPRARSPGNKVCHSSPCGPYRQHHVARVLSRFHASPDRRTSLILFLKCC